MTSPTVEERPAPSDGPDAGLLDRLAARIADRTATVGVIGLGYVGLPLAVTVADRGYPILGVDIDRTKIQALDGGRSYIEAVSDDALQAVAAKGRVAWTDDVARLADCDVIVICVPTPLTAHREPDLYFVETTGRQVAQHMTAGTLVILESTTFPGTTRDVLTPILAEGGLVADATFWVGFSPEREDPGNTSYRTATIPKVVAGDSPAANRLMTAFYGNVVESVVPVSGTSTAEAVKITENVFRAVNIALVNELKVIYDAMGIDVWEVIDGAASKPFGFMPFYPGPGLGGHCIPIDPFYLTWKAREYGHTTRFIELAGEINVTMPAFVIGRLRDVLDRVHGIGLSRARVLLVGITYKKNVADMRESPSVELMEIMLRHGATVDFLDPLIPEIPKMRQHMALMGRRSVSMEAVPGQDYHAVLIATDHDAIDYAGLAALGIPVIDTRNAFARRGLPMTNVFKA
ncbi:nucleotide sugar dehydrogenase [Roseospira navarrensis]|uniref:Nucleotide sugar dehydrogenase n=1 Tax=Roseospira navarrensis TaxID=140058 RepID=A0A7X2D4B3_9PROT|nr:nucleotide sugar dehydrogenase [Roseospira navarrensis]MQX38244.1 nucleotide sugar dehydrogenase [Roseospira navarrensis]